MAGSYPVESMADGPKRSFGRGPSWRRAREKAEAEQFGRSERIGGRSRGIPRQAPTRRRSVRRTVDGSVGGDATERRGDRHERRQRGIRRRRHGRLPGRRRRDGRCRRRHRQIVRADERPRPARRRRDGLGREARLLARAGGDHGSDGQRAVRRGHRALRVAGNRGVGDLRVARRARRRRRDRRRRIARRRRRPAVVTAAHHETGDLVDDRQPELLPRTQIARPARVIPDREVAAERRGDVEGA